MTDQPTVTASATQPTGEIAMFTESIADYLKHKEAINGRLANLSPEESEKLKRGESVKLL